MRVMMTIGSNVEIVNLLGGATVRWRLGLADLYLHCLLLTLPKLTAHKTYGRCGQSGRVIMFNIWTVSSVSLDLIASV